MQDGFSLVKLANFDRLKPVPAYTHTYMTRIRVVRAVE